MSTPIALVTGASRGIGRAIALELGRAGYAVGVNYRESAQAAEQVAAEIAQAGGEAAAFQADVAHAADRLLLMEQVLARWGRLNVLVNNAGITSLGRRDVLEATEESFDAVFATNLKGPFFLSQLAARAMMEGIRGGRQAGGKIINISSISAYAVSTNRADYCMAKAALRMMTQVFAARLAEEKIAVFEVCPGVVESDMTAPVREKYDRLIAEGLSPIRRWGRPEDVARAVVALAGEAFPFSTGDCLNVDGGYHIRRL